MMSTLEDGGEFRLDAVVKSNLSRAVRLGVLRGVLAQSDDSATGLSPAVMRGRGGGGGGTADPCVSRLVTSVRK